MKGSGSLKKKLTFIFLLALALRAVWISTLDNTVDEWKEEGVKEAAWSIIQGRGYSMPRSVSLYPGTKPLYSWREPLFSFFLVPGFFFFGANYLVPKILLAILGSVTAVLLYFLAKETFESEGVGITAAISAAVLPELVFWSGYLTPESLHIFILILPVMFLARSIRSPSFPNLFFSGFFLGIAALSRAQTILIAPLLLLIFALTVSDRKSAFRNAFLMFLFFVLTLSPWVIRNYRIHRQFLVIPTVTGEVFYIANNPGTLKEMKNPGGIFHGEDPKIFVGMSEVEICRWYRREAFKFIFDRPADYLRLAADRFTRFWRFYPHLGTGIEKNLYNLMHLWLSILTSGVIIILFVAGALLSLKKWRPSLLLLVLILSFSFLTISGRATIRYRLPIMPYVILFATYAFHQIFFKQRKNGHV